MDSFLFSDPKRCLEGEDKILNFKLSNNWQRAQVLLKVEFDTEDQVLSPVLYGLLVGFQVRQTRAVGCRNVAAVAKHQQTLPYHVLVCLGFSLVL